MRVITPEESRELALLIRDLSPIQKADFYYFTIVEKKDPYEFLASIPVLKHGTHDQSTHGNWATHNFTEADGEYLQQVYEGTYGFDKDGNYVGTTGYEANAVLSYSGEGYKKINYYARGLNQTEESIELSVASDTVMHNPELFDAAMENYLEINPSEEDLSGAAEQEAIYRYIDANGPKVMQAFREGRTEEGEQAQRTIKRLDEVLAKSPDIFGKTTLYRVYDKSLVENLKEGDVIVDKGFLSTTRIDLTTSHATRSSLAGIQKSEDIVGVIQHAESGKGTGLDVLTYKQLLNEPVGMSMGEKEVLLPRDTPLKFIGYKTDVGTEAKVAVFQRMDK